MEKNYFRLAAKRKSRFPSPKGALNAEQVYDLKLPDLDATARAINAELRSLTEDSFVELAPDPRRGRLADELELVKEVIAEKIAERDAAKARADRAALRETLLAARAVKQGEVLSKASLEELDAQIAALGDV